MGRALLLVTVTVHLALVVVDVMWRLTVITTIGKTPIPAYPAFSQQIALYLVFAFVVWVAGARWAKAWKDAGLGGLPGLIGDRIQSVMTREMESFRSSTRQPVFGGDDPIHDDERDE